MYVSFHIKEYKNFNVRIHIWLWMCLWAETQSRKGDLFSSCDGLEKQLGNKECPEFTV